MTLVVGITCLDGAVVAADRQVTTGAMGRITVGHASTKVQIIGQNRSGLLASSGSVGLAQQASHLIGEEYRNFGRSDCQAYLPKIQDRLRLLVGPAFEMAKIAKDVIGPSAAASDALVSHILAAPFRDGLRVIEITPQVGCMCLTEDNPFTTIGSGKPNADPLLRWMWNTFWPGREQASLNEAVLAAYWTVMTAIELRSEGVGYEADVFVVESGDGGGYNARQLEEAELREHDEFRRVAEDGFRSVRAQLSGTAPPPAGEESPPPSLDA